MAWMRSPTAATVSSTRNKTLSFPGKAPAQISQSRTTTASKGGSEEQEGPRKEVGTREMESTSQVGERRFIRQENKTEEQGTVHLPSPRTWRGRPALQRPGVPNCMQTPGELLMTMQEQWTDSKAHMVHVAVGGKARPSVREKGRSYYIGMSSYCRVPPMHLCMTPLTQAHETRPV